MTSRTHETIRVGLRRIIRDQSVKPSMRMDAIRMLMRVEGLMDEANQSASSKNSLTIHQPSETNVKRMRELLAQTKEQQPK